MHSIHKQLFVGLALSLGVVSTGAMAASPAAPGQERVAPSATGNALVGNVWQLTRVVPGPDRAGVLRLPRQSDRLPELRFLSEQSVNQGRIVVSKLCNTLSSAYWSNGEQQLRATNVVSTMMACPDRALMQLEHALGQQLPKLVSQRLTPGAGGQAARLDLLFSDGSRWELRGTPTDEARFGPAERVFLEVAPETVPCKDKAVGHADCLKVRTLSYDESGRKRVVSDWQTYRGEIKGFKLEPGMRQVLRINRHLGGRVDVLDMIVETERVR